jgi:hypothetical protein
MIDDSIESAITGLATSSYGYGDSICLYPYISGVISPVANDIDVDFIRFDKRCVSCRSPSIYCMMESYRLAIRIVGDLFFGGCCCFRRDTRYSETYKLS